MYLDDTWDLTKGLAIVLFYLVLVGGGIAMSVAKVLATRQCLSLGYPQSEVAWTLDQYCIVRIDQTDVVVPLAEAKKR